ncbi:MAG: branched chain amino acid aminotransferase [Myxococcales bacterium]|nr:branched chain amino acid aminotransferase [Myxococcales bacterium]
MTSTPVQVWIDGRLVTTDAAKLSHLTHTFHYGLGAFEGIRSYAQADGTSAVFRLREHIERLFASCHLVTISRKEIDLSVDQVMAACIDTLRANDLAEGYIRPVIYLGAGAMGIGALTNPVHTMVAAWEWGAYLGAESLEHGIDACVSSFRRAEHSSTLSKGKLTGQYINSILAKREAIRNGYAEAILLNSQGFVTEASGENLFMICDGELITPPLGMNILAGITRATVMELAREQNISVAERRFARDELYLADEVFLTGTAAEVSPVRSIDGRTIGSGTRGPITTSLQKRYFDVVKGNEGEHSHWRSSYTV